MIKIRKSRQGFPFWWVHWPFWGKGDPLPHYAFYTFADAANWVGQLTDERVRKMEREKNESAQPTVGS